MRRGYLLKLLVLFGLLLIALPALAQDEEADTADTTEVDEAAERIATTEFHRELRTVEEDVKRLKERVFRSKATLQLLKEIVIEGATVGSRVVVWHHNKMGSSYTMESVQYYLDGKNIFTRVDPGGSLDDLREVKIHEQTVPPGTHTLQVHIVLRGAGFGVFSYLRNYSFKVQSNYQFKVEDGQITTVHVSANEKSGFARTFVDRPNVEYDESHDTIRREEE